MRWTKGWFRALMLALWCGVSWGAHADRKVLERRLFEPDARTQLLLDGGFEAGAEAPLEAWYFWQEGYGVAEGGGRNGSRGIRCSQATDAFQCGGGQRVELNQDKPCPLLVTGWSRAEQVSGAASPGYSIYVDVEYMDGTNLWAQSANFATGTHEWEQRRFLFVPPRPVKAVHVYALFRGHSGTVHFDDFSLHEFKQDDAYLFEGVPVTTSGGDAEPRASGLGKGLDFVGDPAFFVRDVAADSGFLAPGRWTGGDTRAGEVESLGIALEMQVEARADHIEVLGRITDLRGEDRAVTVYCALPLEGDDWVWSDGPRRHRPAREGVFANTRATGAGATGSRSLYPLAALSGPRGGVAMAVPMDEPRHHRFGYDANRDSFYVAFDVGLSRDVKKSPGAADFRLLVYGFDPEWRFRAALQRYYELFPRSFEKRVEQGGLWMAFTDISTVDGWEDFGFAFHEGTNNVPWDEANGILSFVYTEPMTTWMPLPEEAPRTHAGALDHVRDLYRDPNGAKHDVASETLLSGIVGSNGRAVVHVQKAPWCDGAVFGLNPDPDLPTTEAYPVNQGQAELRRIARAFARKELVPVEGWSAYGDGYTRDDVVFAEGRQSIRMTANNPGDQTGAVQVVRLEQSAATPLVLRASVRAEGVTGEGDGDFSVYVDLAHTDGTPLYGQVIPIETGTQGFVRVERTVRSDKPFREARIHLLLREGHTGTAWFDDVFLGEAGSEENLVQNAGMEGAPTSLGQVDGTYIDSYCFFARAMNYNRAHFASADVPLVFDFQSHEVGILTVFSTFEFQRALAGRMHGDGKLMMANAPLHDFAFPAHYLDVLGTETNWFPEGEWRPTSDADLIFRRAMCLDKPYCFLLNTHYADLTVELIERYMQRSLFYGMFPGFFSENASSNCYFDNPDWYNAARPLFKKYVPLTRQIAAAGWQPVTHARSADARVYVERYGEAGSGAVYFAALNEGEETVATEITVDLEGLGWRGESVETRDMLRGREVAHELVGGALRCTVGLGPYEVSLLALSHQDKAVE
jgi:hypothetical protein